MDKEENKMGLKRKSKPLGTLVDSDDDEPIGTLLKLKGKRNSKKSKLVADAGGNKVKGVEKMDVEDKELGGMDDTLASFRKKLRGSKKDGGSTVAAMKDLNSNAVEPSCRLDESAKYKELDSNLMPEGQKRGLGGTQSGSSGDATVIEGLKVKAKMKNKRSKVNSDTKIIGNSKMDDGLDYSKSGNDALQHEKESASESEAEVLEDSLSAFFQKVHSGMISKSRSSSRVKQRKETQASDDASRPDSDDALEACVGKSQSAADLVKEAPDQGPIKSTLICPSLDDHLPEVLNCTPGTLIDSKLGLSSSPLDSSHIQRPTEYMDDSSFKLISENSASISLVRSSSSSLRACSGKTAGVEDGKIDSLASQAIGDQPGSTNEPPGLNNIPDKTNEVPHCMEAKDLGLSTSLCEGIARSTDDVKLDCGLHADLVPKYSGTCFQGTDHAPFDSPEADGQISECRLSPGSGSEILKYEVAFRKHKNGSHKAVDESEHVLEPSRVLPEGACPRNRNYHSEDEEVNGISSSSIMLDHQGTCADDRGPLADTETKESSLLVGQRVPRNAKKHRHGDMAYEGDIDWDVLMQSQEFFINHQTVDKTREKSNSSSPAVDAENGKAAAVAAGLKARAVGPLEKIKFREVLKRKGGLQEYLECRNHILSVWNKDVRRILPLSDFGVSDAPVVGESSRASLIRDIFTFLDQCGERASPGHCALSCSDAGTKCMHGKCNRSGHEMELYFFGGFLHLFIFVKRVINFGVPSEKEKVGNSIKNELKLLTVEKFEKTGKKFRDSQRGKNDDTFADEKLAGKVGSEQGVNNLEPLQSPVSDLPEGCPLDDRQGINSRDPIHIKYSAGSDYFDSIPSCKDENGTLVPAVDTDLPSPGEAVSGVPAKFPKCGSAIFSATEDSGCSHTQNDSGPRKSIIVVGAGPAGLTAARHLQRQGFIVTVLEARSRIESGRMRFASCLALKEVSLPKTENQDERQQRISEREPVKSNSLGGAHSPSCLVPFRETIISTKHKDSMGKDGTQLLRHCLRLLVLVSNDLLAVRLSGVGKTVKEKVCVHTSRDIRAIASQLVSVWVELFRKEKASKGGLKLLRQSTTLDSKSKSPLVSGKPPLRTHHVDSKGSPKVSASAANQFPFPDASTKKSLFNEPSRPVVVTCTSAAIRFSSGMSRKSLLMYRQPHNDFSRFRQMFGLCVQSNYVSLWRLSNTMEQSSKNGQGYVIKSFYVHKGEEAISKDEID
ncbi:UNVERIFIED_CONTAM: Lysine-specific histone demethylase 13 [Sesamum calycinum]|uniref:Lysine-specific histone demethylase 13 n=1 Tax=Sesamum calycinum TaxID=2727403 RepID=A0AAW2P6P9_9LAMI